MLAFICATIPDPCDRDDILRIYREFRNLMFYTAKKYVQDQSACEDIVQDAILRLIHKIDVVRGKERCILAAYIVTLVRNVSINYLRYEGVRQRHAVGFDEAGVDEIPSPALSLEEEVLAKEKAALLSAALARLPEDERPLLEGKYILEYTDDELARQLDCKSASIRMKLTRARRHALSILNQMQENGGEDDARQTRTGRRSVVCVDDAGVSAAAGTAGAGRQ